MPDMKAYLAEKYMSGPKADAILARAKPKKKKRKHDELSSAPAAAGKASVVVDDDAGWGESAAVPDEEESEEEKAVVASDRGFKKRRRDESGWTTVRGEEEPTPPPPADEQPQVVVEDEEQKPFVGGLLSAKELKRALPGQRTAEVTAEEAALAQETVYRDSSGKKIDTKAARAEAARLKREREEKEAAKMEWGRGLVQKDEEEKRRRELEKQRDRPFARHADDKELNEDLKSKELWNDPAAAFLTKKRSKGPRKPEYTGPPPPPNRFGIKPGYRWDGVDRGNGFEKKLFQNQNARQRQGEESYKWSVDDM